MNTRVAAGLATLVGVAAALVFAIHDVRQQWAAVIAWTCVFLWLTESVPPFVPTLVLLAAVPLLLGPVDEAFRIGEVLRWPADPVIALFLGGYALGAAARRHAIDSSIATLAMRVSRGYGTALVALVLATTALLSMWMSNIAAAAMMIAAIRPIAARLVARDRLRPALLVAVAMGANFGGMSTPIGTGPNAIAISASAPFPITFLHWMAFALPLTVLMLVVTMAILVFVYGARHSRLEIPSERLVVGRPGMLVVALFGAAVTSWITEPWHGVTAPLVALAVTAALFATGLLETADFAKLEWPTLGLIAGGISLGRLLEASNLLGWVAETSTSWFGSRVLVIAGFVFASALLSALMSNTATAAILIPLAMRIDPSPSTAVLVAIASSFGVPFTISTPPNAMARGEGAISARDLLVVGAPLMLAGCAVVAFTGKAALRALGIP